MALPIERLNAEFCGELTFQGQILAFERTLPGDLVQFSLRRRGRGRPKPQVVSVERLGRPPAGVELAEPFCAAYGECGGCRGQHLSYQSQLKLKMEPIAEWLRTDYSIEPKQIAAPAERGQRHRMDFVVEGSVVGQRASGDFARFVDIERCEVQSEAANRLLARVRAGLLPLPTLPFRRNDASNGGLPVGVVKYATIRFGAESGVLLLVVEYGSRDNADLKLFCNDLIDFFQSEKESGLAWSLLLVESESPSEQSMLPDAECLFGSGGYEEILGTRRFFLPYDSFFQPNPDAFTLLLNALFSQIEEYAPQLLATPAGDSPSRHLVDLYCGAGVLSRLFLDRFAGSGYRKVSGYESTDSAIERANRLFTDALDSGEIDEAQFEVVDLNQSAAVAKLTGTLSSATLAIADPPRAGLSPPLRKLLVESGPSYLLYISCNPGGSQREDLRHLAHAYRPLAATLADCFPQTPHLEQGVILERSP